MFHITHSAFGFERNGELTKRFPFSWVQRFRRNKFLVSAIILHLIFSMSREFRHMRIFFGVLIK